MTTITVTLKLTQSQLVRLRSALTYSALAEVTYGDISERTQNTAAYRNSTARLRELTGIIRQLKKQIK